MLAIIPARGGSKGLPKKNIKIFAGLPLIQYTIDAAKKSNRISKIIVSTDDIEIATIASNNGIEIPFMRPPELATDTSNALDTYIYTIEKINKTENYQINDFIVLQPTSPLRTAKDIDAAISIFKSKKADSVISITKASYPPQWNKKLTKLGCIIDYFSNNIENKNRQQYEQAYIPNGAIYIFKYQQLKTNYNYYSKNTFAYIMPRERSIDIDTELDFRFAEFLMKNKFESKQ